MNYNSLVGGIALSIYILVILSCNSQKIIPVIEQQTLANEEKRGATIFSLTSRLGNCEQAIIYMKALLEFGPVEKQSNATFKVNYKLKGIQSELLIGDSPYRYFHLSPECFVGLDYLEVLQLSKTDQQIIESSFSKNKSVRLELNAENYGLMHLLVSEDQKIRSAASEYVTYSDSFETKDTIADYFIESLGTDAVTIEYTKAILGPSKKTVSTQNNTLLIVTEILGDTNKQKLNHLNRCYFNPEHFIGLTINEVLAVFEIESLGQIDLDIISRIVVNVKGHSQLIMRVVDEKVRRFRFN